MISNGHDARAPLHAEQAQALPLLCIARTCNYFLSRLASAQQANGAGLVLPALIFAQLHLEGLKGQAAEADVG